MRATRRKLQADLAAQTAAAEAAVAAAQEAEEKAEDARARAAAHSSYGPGSLDAALAAPPRATVCRVCAVGRTIDARCARQACDRERCCRAQSRQPGKNVPCPFHGT
jgi:hypothetical protein